MFYLLIQPNIEFAAAWARRIEKDLGKVRVCLAAVEDLIELKTSTGRQRDESDIQALRQLQRLGLG